MRGFIIGILFTGLFSGILAACEPQDKDQNKARVKTNKDGEEKILPGAARTSRYFPLLKGKKVALVANPTSQVDNVHLLDTLLAAGINVDRVMGPEHGFRGDAEAGEHVKDGVDTKSGVEVISLYGSHRKPTNKDLEGIDIVVFDVQDVGVRFYTYVSTMHYVMEKCAEMDIPFMVLDRPNPNGFYVDGPVLNKGYSSFVGMHEVPLVHGMTLGEFARMINGEGWLQKELKVDLKVIPVKNYSHSDHYKLPVAPSPNLPGMKSVYLYPSLGLFEGTKMSIGRGTDHPFQVIGHPAMDTGNFCFTPHAVPGASTDPKYEDQKCRGWDLRDTAMQLRDQGKLHLGWLIQSFEQLKQKTEFFRSFFNKLSGNKTLRKKIEYGWSEKKIRKSWQEDIESFMRIREKYLLYEDF